MPVYKNTLAYNDIYEYSFLGSGNCRDLLDFLIFYCLGKNLSKEDYLLSVRHFYYNRFHQISRNSITINGDFINGNFSGIMPYKSSVDLRNVNFK